MLKKASIILSIFILGAIVLYSSGPKAEFKKVSNEPSSFFCQLPECDDIVADKEAHIKGIKEDNESQFFWTDSLNKTPYALVYLHGFSASYAEAMPILQNLVDRYGMNAYLPRLYLHGLQDPDAFVSLNPKGLVDSAREAIAVGKSIGDTVIIMSTSTGSTLAAYLAAGDPEIHALICTSPNFDLYDSKSKLITGPWGKQLMRYMMGGNYREWNAGEEIQKYWTTKNRIEGHIALRSLLDQTMTKSTFQAITQPVYLGYYYRDVENMDNIISIDAIKLRASQLSSPDHTIWLRAFDNARGHVISSEIMNPNWKDVENSIFDFCDTVLRLNQSDMNPETIKKEESISLSPSD